MSSFYGNIKTDPKVNLTFDKVYHNRSEMEANCTTDGVFNGRYVFIDYGIPYPSNFERVFIDQKAYDENPSSFYRVTFDTSTRTINATQCKSPNSEGKSTYEVGKSYYILTDKLSQNLTSEIPGATYQDLNLYAYNLSVDEAQYGDGFNHTVWQKVWTSTGSNDTITEKYVLIAFLDSKPPKLSLIVDAPSDTKGPHFDPLLSNDLSYKYHVPRNWKFAEDTDFNYNADGFKIDTANNIGGENHIVLDKTKKSGEKYPVHRTVNITDAAILENGSIKKDLQPDTCKFNISLVGIGNAMSDMWDIVYPKVGPGNTIRDTFIGSDRAKGHTTPISIDTLKGNDAQKYTLAGSIRYAWHMIGLENDKALPTGGPNSNDTLWGNFNSIKEYLGTSSDSANNGKETVLGYWNDFKNSLDILAANWDQDETISSPDIGNIRIMNKPMVITPDGTEGKGIIWFWNNPSY